MIAWMFLTRWIPIVPGTIQETNSMVFPSTDEVAFDV